MDRVGEVACFGSLALLAEMVGGFLFGFCESGRDGFGFGLEGFFEIFESFEVGLGAFEGREVVLVSEGEVGLKGEGVGLIWGDHEFVGRCEGENEFSFGGVGFDFELRWFGMGEIGESDGDVAFDFCVLGEGEGDLEGFSGIVGKGSGGGGENEGRFFSVGDAERKELGEAGVMTFGVPVSDMP